MEENQHLERLGHFQITIQDFRQKVTEENILACALYCYILFIHLLEVSCCSCVEQGTVQHAAMNSKVRQILALKVFTI